MSTTEITVRLPSDLLNALRTLSRGENMKVNDLIRSIVAQEVLRHGGLTGHGVRREDAISALRVQLGRLLAEAEDLDTLNWSLKERGYVLRQDGEGYMLCSWPVHTPICAAADLGLSQRRLQTLDPEPSHERQSGWALSHALSGRVTGRKSA